MFHLLGVFNNRSVELNVPKSVLCQFECQHGGYGNERTLMITAEFVWQRLRSLLIEIGQVDPDLITEEASIDGGLSIESVAFVEITVTLEEEFEVALDPLEILECSHLGAMAKYIHHAASIPQTGGIDAEAQS